MCLKSKQKPIKGKCHKRGVSPVIDDLKHPSEPKAKEGSRFQGFKVYLLIPGCTCVVQIGTRLSQYKVSDNSMHPTTWLSGKSLGTILTLTDEKMMN